MMKKVCIAICLIFVISLGCKKLDSGGNLCACSPISYPDFFGLTIKNNVGADLLNAETAGYLDKAQISLYSIGTNNEIKPISFSISSPFTYSSTVKINAYQIISQELFLLAKNKAEIFYLKLGSDKIFELQVKIENNKISSLLINDKVADKEIPSTTEEMIRNIFTLKM